MVRDDTGFGISVLRTGEFVDRVEITGVNIDGIGSAGMWFTQVISPIVTNSVIENCKADGVHFADGCSDIIVDGNIFTNNGTGAVAVVISHPFGSTAYGVISGLESALTGKSVSGAVSSGNIVVRFADGTYPAASGANVSISGIFPL